MRDSLAGGGGEERELSKSIMQQTGDECVAQVCATRSPTLKGVPEPRMGRGVGFKEGPCQKRGGEKVARKGGYLPC